MRARHSHLRDRHPEHAGSGSRSGPQPLTHLPIIVDPSHGTGKRWLVKPLAIGGVAVGADGLIVEVHPRPDEALSDAEQQLDLDGFRDLMEAIVPVHDHVRGLYSEPSTGGAPIGDGAGLSKH